MLTPVDCDGLHLCIIIRTTTSKIIQSDILRNVTNKSICSPKKFK